MGLSLVISLSGKALLKGILGAALGLLASLVGQNPVTGAARLTFGWVELMAGISFISVIIGLFSISEVLLTAEQEVGHLYTVDIRHLMPRWADLRQCLGAMLRSCGLGFFLGLLPGCAPSVTTFIAYDVERRCSKTPERFGKGAIEGVAAAEGANNACTSGGFVPLFAFGLPVAPSMAVLLGGLMMYGLQPGPRLFQQKPEFVWAVIASMYIGNVILLLLNLPLVGVWARIAMIPFPILGPLILLFSVVGAYAIRGLMFDVWVALLFGAIGYYMRKTGFPIVPMVLASVLAQMLETSLQTALLISQGSWLVFVTRPISAVFTTLALLSIARGLWVQFRARKLEVAEEDAEL
jgi:putative tricarboxylic transport membrane protein